MNTDKDDTLTQFVSSLSGGDGIRVEESLGDGYVRLRVAEAERRQAKHDIRCVEDALVEMLRNARDAGASHIFVALSKVDETRTLTIVDDGSGIPNSMHEKVFGARVTSKLDSMRMDRWGVHGRGMALYSIKENALSCGIIQSDVGRGAVIQASFDVGKVRERADQSTWPRVKDKGAELRITGPHNMVRACVEFGYDVRGSCKVYIGSPAEVIATMRARLSPYHENGTRRGSIAQRFAAVSDPHRLRELSHGIGLDMSERTAYRIIRGQIKPLRHVVAQSGGTPASNRAVDGIKTSYQRQKLALTDDERNDLVQSVSREFERIAQNYYLGISDKPVIRVADGIVTISIPYGEVD